MADESRTEARRGGGRIGWFWWLVLLLSAGGALGWLVWWALVGGPASSRVVTIAAVVNDPARFAGETVAVSGRLGPSVGERGFLLVGEAGETVLVVHLPEVEIPAAGRAGRPRPLVEATGEVFVVSEAALAQRLGPGAAPGAFSAWEGKPAIFAAEVTPVVEEP